MTIEGNPEAFQRSAVDAWSRRVRKVGGYIQLGFAAFWLVRGGLSLTGAIGIALATAGLIVSIAVLVYAIRVTAGTAPVPTGQEARRIERSITLATAIELVASIALPFIVIAWGHDDWVLPSVAITIGPLLLWLDHLVHIPRLRPVGWALTIGPLLLVVLVSDAALVATTGLAAGFLLLGTATAGFHDLAHSRPKPPKVAASPIPKTP